MTGFPPTSQSPPINLGAFGVAASAALVVLFALCWIVAALLPGLEFTKAPVSSFRALIEGVIWSIVFGWIIAIVMVPTYNRIAGA
jgi:cellulose synthase/poly-beta-1,6-N-acetylglucosamine synthase-like glycosyltransferase